MKWFFSILLIANLGMFIWLYPQQARFGNVTQQPRDIGELRLARELSEEDAKDDLPRETLAESAPMPVTAPAVAEMTTRPASPLPAPRVGDDVTELTSSVSETKRPEKMQCWSMGVFEKRSQAELLSVQLLALGLKPEITSETRNEQAGYWVLIPPQNDRETAIDVARRLEEAGVTDLWRFTSGNLAHAISLGLFRDLERAEARKDQIGELGFNTEIMPRYRQQTQYWVKYSYIGVSPVTVQKWQEFQTLFPGIERETASCL